MNYTEMEAKVREATNNEPWGASSSMMTEIANGTYNLSVAPSPEAAFMLTFFKPAAERDHANDIQAFHREVG